MLPDEALRLPLLSLLPLLLEADEESGSCRARGLRSSCSLGSSLTCAHAWLEAPRPGERGSSGPGGEMAVARQADCARAVVSDACAASSIGAGPGQVHADVQRLSGGPTVKGQDR